MQSNMRQEESEVEMIKKAVHQAQLQNEDAAAAIAQKQRRADKVRHFASGTGISWACHAVSIAATSSIDEHCCFI